ncbi:DUF1801 domain-containing protein [Ningiella sp. W23]|uniref:DUF1801 domain-containing protein n=1 Tax=Ningiella sp. W23 TaxID=3023715 RepID=UPI003756B372
MKTQKPLSTKKPPVPNEDIAVFDEWFEDLRPKIAPIVRELHALVQKHLPNPQFAVKWGNAFYGSKEHGWVIQLSPYNVSVNIVFLNSQHLLNPPEMGGETRYVKLASIAEVNNEQLATWVKESCHTKGWAWE